MRSERIDFIKLSNTRDLGGIQTKTGKKIIKGKLIRSGNLCKANESDLDRLRNSIELIVDFRTPKELIEKPDPVIDGINSIHLPIMEELTDGITREKKAAESVIKKYVEDPEGARKYMINIYKNFVTEKLPLNNYSRFLGLLLEPREKAVLWHCTAGKDRAGFAAVIIQEILGVDRDTILKDYLYTNDCLKEEIKLITLGLMQKYNIDGKDIKKTLVFQEMIDYIFGAKEEYILGLYDKIKELYGSFEGFVRDGLGIQENHIKLLRKLYLC